MEETRNIKRVGNYSTSQADTDDCEYCHNAKFATVIIDGLCLDCYLIEAIKQCKAAFATMGNNTRESHTRDWCEEKFAELCEILRNIET